MAKFRPKIKDLPPKAPAAAGEAAQDDGENGLMLRCHALGTGVYRRNEQRRRGQIAASLQQEWEQEPRRQNPARFCMFSFQIINSGFPSCS